MRVITTRSLMTRQLRTLATLIVLRIRTRVRIGFINDIRDMTNRINAIFGIENNITQFRGRLHEAISRFISRVFRRFSNEFSSA